MKRHLKLCEAIVLAACCCSVGLLACHKTHSKKDEWSEQIFTLESQLNASPTSAFLHSQLAAAYAGKKDWPKFEEHIQAAIKLEPENPLNYFAAAVVYENRSMTDLEIAMLEKAIKADARNPVSHYKLAGAYQTRGNTAKSQVELETAWHLLSQLPHPDTANVVPRNAILNNIYYDQLGNSYPLFNMHDALSKKLGREADTR